MLKKEESIAYSYLTQPPHERQMILVGKTELIIRLKKHDKVFPLESILGLKTGQKILLFPTVVGGIVCPFFLIGAFNGLGNIWLMMTLAFSGLLALYYGLSGSDALILQTKVKDFDFFVDTINPHLNSFCTFYNKVIMRGRLDFYFCVKLDANQWKEAQMNGVIQIPEDGLPIYTIDEIQRDSDDLFFSIVSPFQNGYKIGFEQGDDKQIVPLLFSPVKTEHLRQITGI